MEGLIDFNTWFDNFKEQDTVYMAVFDNQTGQVISVGPSHAFENELHKLIIDSETAELIIEGTIKISSCVVDMQNNVMEIAEVKNVFKIDDVLHRIISKEYSDVENPDISLTYNRETKALTFQLSEVYNGTRKILWDGETVMNFLITDYNDPNMLYNMISVKISDLLDQSFVVDNLEVPARFSIYTRRLFKHYVVNFE